MIPYAFNDRACAAVTYAESLRGLATQEGLSASGAV